MNSWIKVLARKVLGKKCKNENNMTDRLRNSLVNSKFVTLNFGRHSLVMLKSYSVIHLKTFIIIIASTIKTTRHISTYDG